MNKYYILLYIFRILLDTELQKEERLSDFIKNELTGEMLDIPGMTERGVSSFKKAGIYNSYQLIGSYLSLKKMDKTLKEHHIAFLRYLTMFEINKSNRERIAEGIAEKVSRMIPGFYDASIMRE